MVSGYSGTPLIRKLGVKDEHRLVLTDAPDGFGALLGREADGTSLRGRVDVAVCFVVQRKVLAARVKVLRNAIAPDGMAWIAWPKKASKVPTDISEDVVRAVALPTGLVDVKVCAIDETWSGLKLVIRKELR